MVLLDLGAIFARKLSFTNHYDMICSSTIKFLGFMISTCKIFSDTSVIKIHNTFILSTMEYASAI